MIDRKSMIQRVYIQTLKAESVSKVIIATDDERILKHVEGFGGEAVMTSSYDTGTRRCAEAHRFIGGNYDAVINVPADVPFIQPAQIDAVAASLQDGAEIATLVKRIDNKRDYESPVVIKVIVSQQGEALYFSRAPVPYVRKGISKPLLDSKPFYKQTELFGFKSTALHAISKLPLSGLEETETIEQLRWLDAGYRIRVRETHFETLGIDSFEDLEKLKDVRV